MKSSKRIILMWLGCFLIAVVGLFPADSSRALADDVSTSASSGLTSGAAGTIAQIVGGKGFTALLKTDGTVWTWGDNLRGKLGGGLDNRPLPTQVKGIQDVTSISASGYHTLALKKDGTVWTWGQNTYGQLGDGTTTDRNAPVQVQGVDHIVSVATGYYHSVALKDDGTVWTWGQNVYGQLGNKSYNPQKKPVQVANLADIKQIASGAYHTLALDGSGTAWGWGDNTNGEMGNGFDQNTLNNPIMINNIGYGKAIQIAAGYNFSMFLKEDGKLLTCGLNTSGQRGTIDSGEFLYPLMTAGPQDYTSIAAGYNYAIALEKNGTVRTWGNNKTGQLGQGVIDDINVPTHVFPEMVNGLPKASLIGAGYDFAFAMGTDGTLWGWGNNVYGQLGDGTTKTQSSPLQIKSFEEASAPPLDPGAGSIINSQIHSSPLAVGDSNTLALKANGLFGWGDNIFGQLGNGTNAGTLSPQAIPIMKDTVAVAEGSNHVLAVKSDGSLWAWGSNYFGQLGDGSTENRSTPVQVQGLKGAVSVSAGNNHTVALLNNGTVWTFGENSNGQLGIDDFSTSRHNTPVPVTSISHIVAVAAGANFTLALQDNGTVWAWGDNANGQLGDGTSVYKRQPVQVPNLTGVVSISAGKNHSIALKNDGTVWTWGFNSFGQLGDGTTTSSNAPISIGNLTDVKAIAAGGYHTLVIRSDGTVWSWGNNSFGQLGDGGFSNQLSPVQVKGVSRASTIAAGTSHSAVMESDDTVWTWGANSNGQLGNGSRTNHSSAAMVTGFVPAFKDISSHWAKDNIILAMEQGYVDGYDDGTFSPDKSVTRAEYVKMVASALHLQTDKSISGQPWYQTYTDALQKAGVMQANDLQTGWNEPITRKEMSTIALRATEATLQKPNSAITEAFVLLEAVKTGLLQGFAGGDLAPNAATTRAQSVTMITRILTVKQGGQLTVDDQALHQAESNISSVHQ